MADAISGVEDPGASRSADAKWVVMRRKVEFLEMEEVRDGEDASLEHEEPPRATVLSVYRGALPEPDRHRAFGFIHSVDDAGLVLFSSAQGEKFFLVCDLRARNVFCLPKVLSSLSLRLSSDRMGVIADHRSGARDYLVAQLHATVRRLLCFSTHNTKGWSVMEIRASSSVQRDRISSMLPELVIPHGGRLAFVDLERGLLLSVDPFAAGAAPRIVPLPNPSGSDDDSSAGFGGIGRRRCVMPSCGELCYMRLHGAADSPTVSAWKLVDEAWTCLYTVLLCDVFPASTCNSAGLGLLHPQNQWVIFFFVDESLIAVDMIDLEQMETSSGIFFTEACSVSYSSLDVWAWVPPSSAPQPGVNSEERPKLPYWRRRLRGMTRYVKEHPEVLITAGKIVEQGASYIPVEFNSLKPMKTGGTYLGKAIAVTGKAMQWKQAAAKHWIQGVAEEDEFTGNIYDLTTIETEAEASSFLDSWRARGKEMDGIRVKFPEEMSSVEKRHLRQMFEQQGAEDLLHHATELDDSWIFVQV